MRNDLWPESNHRIGVFGTTGSGKSNLCAYLQTRFKRRLVVDIMAEYSPKNFDFVVSSPKALFQLFSLISRRQLTEFSTLYRWDATRIEDDLAEINSIMSISYRLGKHMVVLEEIHSFMKREYMPRWLKAAVTQGRHRGLGILGTSQRPAEVSKTFVSNCAHVYASQFYEPNDLKYFQSMLGSSSTSQLSSLKKHEFLHLARPNQIEIVKAPLVKRSGIQI